MGDVINFVQKNRDDEGLTTMLWACNCGSTDFEIYQIGTVLCSECETVQMVGDLHLLEVIR